MLQNDPLNEPEAGAVIDFRYLEHKDASNPDKSMAEVRPCLIWNVRTIERLQLVAVLPIISGATGARVSIPPAERAALGLDSMADVVFEEANVFLWSGPYLQPQPDRSLVRQNRASKQLLETIADGMTGRSRNIVFRP
ncbi:hypothetical protein [Erythrobacter sp. R86502]|uniref:hypothetical protein n=1 Tax=Erythrobacter sp. R86502 TaxID=3093846 RepID=UPI0036D328A1